VEFGYLTIRQAAEKWGLSIRRVQQFCELGLLEGAERPGREWLIPKSTNKPVNPQRPHSGNRSGKIEK